MELDQASLLDIVTGITIVEDSNMKRGGRGDEGHKTPAHSDAGQQY